MSASGGAKKVIRKKSWSLKTLHFWNSKQKRHRNTKKLKRQLAKLPAWSLLAFIVDFVLFFVMQWLGSSWCGDASTCYRLDPKGDRFTDYLALIVAVMAILIPVAIELWKKQFVAQNLSPKSPLDETWSAENQMIYLKEPVASMAAFVFIAMILPLFIRNSALFYASVAYGVFLLAYVFLVSFFRKPVDIYELSALNPPDDDLPSKEIMNELAASTLENTPSGAAVTSTTSEVAWQVQLSETKTFRRLIEWLNKCLNRRLKGDFNKIALRSILVNFISKCDINTLWPFTYDKDGEVRLLFANKEFYKNGNLSHAAQILKAITERFIDSDGYYETIGVLLATIPVADIDEKDLALLLEPTFRLLFERPGSNGLTLKDALPDDWQVTTKSLQNKLPKTIANIYFQWIWRLQMQSDRKIPNETAVQDVTEIIFPDVEPMLFAKLVLLKLNTVRLLSSNTDDNAAILEPALNKWGIFGHVGRTTAMWEPASSDDTLEEQWKRDFRASEAATLELVKRLGWFAWDKSMASGYVMMLQAIINATKWSHSTKKSWNDTIDRLKDL